MIKTTLTVTTIAVSLAFGLGFYAGWKTTLRIIDNVMARATKKQ